MPIYVFRCSKCEEEFEVKKSVKEWTPTAKCSCGREAEIVIQSNRIVFKGPGFYETDYKKKK